MSDGVCGPFALGAFEAPLELGAHKRRVGVLLVVVAPSDGVDDAGLEVASLAAFTGPASLESSDLRILFLGGSSFFSS